MSKNNRRAGIDRREFMNHESVSSHGGHVVY